MEAEAMPQPLRRQMISSSVPRHQLLATRHRAGGAFFLPPSYFPHLALSSFILLTFSFLLHAAQPKEALLIANGKYSHFAGLAHPSPDAAKLSAALEQLGFRVRVVSDGNREQMLDAIAEFERGLRNTGAIAFFHYGGHGVQVDGKNYLLPADADIPDERRVATRAVALDEVMTAMDAAAARASIIVIDACRDNPLPAGSGRNLARGLSVVGMKPKNSIVIYAAEAGSKALDGLFTPILAAALQQKGRTIDQVMKSVRSEVYAKSSGQQTPGEYNQLFEELFLGEPGENLAPEKVFAPKPAPTPFAAPTPATLTKDDMVLVIGGRLPNASGLAEKSVKSFYISRTEVTWLEWKKVREWAADHGYDIGNAGAGSGNDHPVRDVSWYDCVKWCNAKSMMEGLEPIYSWVSGLEGSENVALKTPRANGYRLPTEAEWEWAARGGLNAQGYTFAGSNNLNTVGWYEDNSDGRTRSVGTKMANELGIHDMSGNVWEWCEDNEGDTRRIRGGSWSGYADYCKNTHRAKCGQKSSFSHLGFRLARSL